MLALDDAALIRLLEDDCGLGDLTTESLEMGHQPGRFEFAARYAMTVCGVEEAVRLGELAGLAMHSAILSGTALAPSSPILEGKGSAQDLHRVWKAAQVLIEWASGISTAVAEIVSTAARIPVACTRKNVPGTKSMSIKAVKAGGATMHRLGLAETLLIFPEHRLFLNTQPMETIAQLRRRQPEKKIVVEVKTVEEAQDWAIAGADVLQLEKFDPETVARCRLAILDRAPLPTIAVAGGIHAKNAAAYISAGADVLVTSFPFSAPPRDVAVRFIPCR